MLHLLVVLFTRGAQMVLHLMRFTRGFAAHLVHTVGTELQNMDRAADEAQYRAGDQGSDLILLALTDVPMLQRRRPLYCSCPHFSAPSTLGLGGMCLSTWGLGDLLCRR